MVAFCFSILLMKAFICGVMPLVSGGLTETVGDTEVAVRVPAEVVPVA